MQTFFFGVVKSLKKDIRFRGNWKAFGKRNGCGGNESNKSIQNMMTSTNVRKTWF